MSHPQSSPASRAPRGLILLAFLAFISLGLPDTLLGVAWPSICRTFFRDNADIGQLLAPSAIGYLLSSFSGGTLVLRLGVARLLVVSSGLVVIGMALNALSPVWPAMLVAAAFGGLGAGAIDAGINTFAAKRFSPRIVNFLHACWGIGATGGPAIMTLCITQVDPIRGWRIGYIVVGAVMLVMCGVFLKTRRAWDLGGDANSAEGTPHAGILEAMRQPRVWVGMTLFAVYGGAEAGTGTWLFSILRDRDFSVATAGTFVSLYWGSLTAGRFAFGQAASRYAAPTVIRAGLALALVGVTILTLGSWLPVTRPLAPLGAALLGFGLAPTFPTMISLTPLRVGERFAPQAVGFQVAGASAGIVLFPTLLGFVAKYRSLEAIPPFLLGFTVLTLVLHELSARMALQVKGFDVPMAPAGSNPEASATQSQKENAGQIP